VRRSPEIEQANRVITEGMGNTTFLNEKARETYDFRELQRIKLKTDYSDIVQHVNDLMHTDPLRGCDLIVDDQSAESSATSSNRGRRCCRSGSPRRRGSKRSR
jgi:hypothetical protein